MTSVWAQRQTELLRDCVVSPDVFTHMVDHLRDFVRPYHTTWRVIAYEGERGIEEKNGLASLERVSFHPLQR